jgi:putative ABC transport system ATP-binding protein
VSVLELDHVSKVYRDATETVCAVDDVSLAIGPGEIVVLTGPSGSGKSTLLQLATGLVRPDRGGVRWDGRDLGGLSQRDLADQLRTYVGIAYQNPQLLPGVPAIENAGMKILGGNGSMREARRAALPWLVRVGLEHRLEHTPERLSGGERQRVAIARALVGGPRLLLLDEPTGNLDSQRGAEILDLVGGITREGAGVLIVTHDAHVETVADRVHELRDGQLTDSPRLAATG